ncbi:hypothetical protein PANO111632_03890 [Paracoccus nototheniae]
MNSRQIQKWAELLVLISPRNSIGATLLLVFGVAIVCAAFSTIFWIVG